MMARSLGTAFALAMIGGAACDSSTDPDIDLVVQPVTLEAVGDVRQMEATVSGSTVLPEWTSTNDQVATITRAGMVTAVAAGTATVRARIGGDSAEAVVTVLPDVDVRLQGVVRGVDPSGTPKLTMTLRNQAGRGYYMLELVQARTSPAGAHQVVLRDLGDRVAAPGMDLPFSLVFPGASQVDWVSVYSRNPHQPQYRRTACVRLDGGQPCPIP